MTSARFLGTGNFLAPGRYWNSFVIDGSILVEPSPTALPNMRRAQIQAGQIDTVVISHFHPDHTFGWPFLLMELMMAARPEPIHIIGPPNVEEFLRDMMRLGSVMNLNQEAHSLLDLRYIEADGTWQKAGELRFRAVEVVHVPQLRCYGYLLDRGDRIVGYSGDTQPCDGLDELAGESNALILECNGRHPMQSHMDVEAVRALHARFAQTKLVVTHLGADVEASTLPGVLVPDDYEHIADL